MEHSEDFSSDSDSLLSSDSLLDSSAPSSSSDSSVSSDSSDSNSSSSSSDPDSETSSATNTSFSSSEDEFFLDNEELSDIRDEVLEYIDHDDVEEGPPGSKYKFHLRRILDCSNTMSDKCFLALFRMTRVTFEKLFQEVCLLLPPGKQAFIFVLLHCFCSRSRSDKKSVKLNFSKKFVKSTF